VPTLRKEKEKGGRESSADLCPEGPINPRDHEGKGP